MLIFIFFLLNMVDNLLHVCGLIVQVGRIKQKRGYKDQWPWNIKIYTDEKGNNKGDACLAYEDPSAAHSAGSFYNGASSSYSPVFNILIFYLVLRDINHDCFISDYDLRGYKISVTMAEKSAPRVPPAYNHGYPLYIILHTE